MEIYIANVNVGWWEMRGKPHLS